MANARPRELSHDRVAGRSRACAARCDARGLLRTAQRVGLDVAEPAKLLRDLKAVRRRLENFFHGPSMLELLHEFTARRVA